MRVRLMVLAAFVGTSLATSGCATEQTDEPSSDAEARLSGGFNAKFSRPTFGKDTGTLLIRDGCTAARVGPRHILTAGHCVGGLLPGAYLSITQSPSDEGADWNTVKVSKVWLHPSFAPVDLLCGSSLTCPRDYGVPDIAVIETSFELPSTITSARVGTQRYEAAGYARQVYITGYGCEGGLDGPTPGVRSLGFMALPIEPVSEINRYGQVLSDLQMVPFDGTYMLTRGAGHEDTGASLCPGDSGGPVLLATAPYPGGPAYATNVVIGVNSDYTFNDSGLSTFNIHTRLSNDAPHFVGAWLQTILPESSFLTTMDP